MKQSALFWHELSYSEEKGLPIDVFVTPHNINILALTGTRLCLVPRGYDILQMTQSDKCGRGAMVLFKEGLGLTIIHSSKDDIFIQSYIVYHLLDRIAIR